MKTKNIIFIAGFLALLGVIISTRIVLAQDLTVENIQYPIAELGNCKDKMDCKIYCDKPENSDACMSFALQNNLMSQEEVSKAKKFIAAAVDGPGGCTTKNSCKEYCDNINHIDECISFAEKNGLMPPKKLEEAKKVRSAIRRGVKPPNCKSKKECDDYCEDAAHMQECVAFAESAGFLQGKELEDAQKVLRAVKKGIAPPPCKGKKECDDYCSNPDNMKACMNFAMEAGLMSEEEKTNAQKMLTALNKGVRPPNCKSKEECDIYCQQEEHMEECTNFAVAAGMMTEGDVEMAKKTGGKGPGGCRGKEECDAFCKDRQEECFNFAKEKGLLSPEELQKTETGERRSDLNQAGPGGCKSPEECDAYCQKNPAECQNFTPEQEQYQEQRREEFMNEGPEMPYVPCKGEECQQQIQNCKGENCQNMMHPGEIPPPQEPLLPMGPEQEFYQSKDMSPPEPNITDVPHDDFMPRQPSSPPLDTQKMPKNTLNPPKGAITPQSVMGALIFGVRLFLLNQ